VDIAFTSIILVLLFLPGLIFFRAYFANSFSSKYFKSSFSSIIPTIIIPSLILHFLAFQFIKPFVFKYEPNIEYIGLLLTIDKPEILSEIFLNIKLHLKEIATYFLLLYLFSAILGFSIWSIIRKLKLDRKIPPLRFPNKWYYIFTGELLEFSDNWKYKNSKNFFRKKKTSDSKVENVSISIRYVEVLVQIGNYSIIYSGILEDYGLSKSEAGVEFIKLSNVTKSILSLKSKVINKSIIIPGDFLIIPFIEIKNLNITYYSLNAFDTP
jgi:hypothetical protein